ncbi:energy transducer TonB [Ferruginibacter profundus]
MRYFAIIIAVLMSLSGQSQKKRQKHQQEGDNIIFKCIFPEPATFEGGINSLHRFIAEQFIQPDAVPDSTFFIKGIVQFVIDTSGNATQFAIIDSAGHDCDKEIIRILCLTKWKPARYEGILFKEFKRLPYTIMFEKSDAVNSDTSPQSAPACPPQTLLAKYVL